MAIMETRISQFVWLCFLLFPWQFEKVKGSNEDLNLFLNDPLRSDEDFISAQTDDEYNPSQNFNFDHQAILGTHEDAVQFRRLDPQEAKARLSQLIKRMDSNDDGKVDRDELIRWIMQSFEQLDLETSRQRMRDHDANNDGLVSWNEFLNKVYGYSEKEMEELKQHASPETKAFLQSLEQEKVKFDSADLDRNGVLNEMEYTAFEHPHNYPHMAPYEIIHTLKDFDRDKDGLISEKEYLQDDKMHHDALLIEKANFKRYDKNGDGMLDKEELVEWVTPGFNRTATDEAEHLLMETDQDKDGQLSEDEILQQHELWVGSQATDYGRHLEQMPRDEL